MSSTPQPAAKTPTPDAAEPPPAADAPTTDPQSQPQTQPQPVSEKRTKKKGKKKKASGASGASEGSVAVSAAAPSRTEEMRKLAYAMQGIRVPAPDADSSGESSKAAKGHKFWDSQPVPRIDESNKGGEKGSGLVDKARSVSEVRPDPYKLPNGFHWVTVDVDNSAELQEVYTLLTENYVEDDDNMFRFDYSPAFLKWALKPPGFRPEWHIGLRADKNNKLLAFITGIPAKVHVLEDEMMMAEINFLCVHKKLRSKRLAPVLIKEVTRRVNLTDVWQAVYTAGVVLPKPVARCRYWHRSLNPKKLIDVGFSRIGPRMTMTRTIRLYKLPEQPCIPGIRPMEEKDAGAVCALLRDYLKRFKLWIEFDEHEVRHWLLPRENVINSYVVESADGVVTDFCSFYHLPSSIIGHDTYSTLRAAYSFYNVATSVSLEALTNDALIMAKKCDFDVFNCLDIQDNGTFLKNLKFGIGDGHLQYCA